MKIERELKRPTDIVSKLDPRLLPHRKAIPKLNLPDEIKLKKELKILKK